MARVDDGEVPTIESGHLDAAEPFGHGDYGSVRRTKRKIGVAFDEVSHPHTVVDGQLLGTEVPTAQRTQKRRLRTGFLASSYPTRRRPVSVRPARGQPDAYP